MPFRKVSVGPLNLAVGVGDHLASSIKNGAVWKAIHRTPAEDVSKAGSTQVQPDGSRPVTPELMQSINAIDWYHTMDLGGGLVTKGRFDHRPFLKSYPIPDRLDGMRVLDIATFDGFWAQEFERRGAREVIGVDIPTFGDIDIPGRIRMGMDEATLGKKLGAGFELARRVCNSNVRREVCNVYDLSETRLGKFDFVFCGSLLLHLRDPIKALENMLKLMSGSAVLVESYNPGLPLCVAEYKGWQGHVWWAFSLDALTRMIHDTGFSSVELVGTFPLLNKQDNNVTWHAAYRLTA